MSPALDTREVISKISIKTFVRWVLVYTFIIPVLWKQKQEYCEIEVSLDSIARLSRQDQTKEKASK